MSETQKWERMYKNDRGACVCMCVRLVDCILYCVVRQAVSGEITAEEALSDQKKEQPGQRPRLVYSGMERGQCGWAR